MGYWVSFLDGLQHVVLFTENKAVRDHVLCGNRTERAHLEVTLSLIGMGLSLVDDVKGLEIAYIGLPQYNPSLLPSLLSSLPTLPSSPSLSPLSPSLLPLSLSQISPPISLYST